MTPPKPTRGRAVPRWGWRHEPHTRSFEDAFSEAALGKIFLDLGASDPHRKRATKRALHSAFDIYWTEKDQDQPTTAEVRAAFSALRRHAEPLARMIEDLDDRSKSALAYRLGERVLQSELGTELMPIATDPWLATIDEEAGGLSPSRLWALLQIAVPSLVDAIDAAAPALRPEPRGRPTNAALVEFVNWLASAYEEATGHDAASKITVSPDTGEYWSPFLDFVTFCLARTDPDHGMSNSALGEAVRRHLGRRPSSHR